MLFVSYLHKNYYPFLLLTNSVPKCSTPLLSITYHLLVFYPTLLSDQLVISQLLVSDQLVIPESLPKQYRVNIERSSTLPYLFNQLSNHSKGGIYLLTLCLVSPLQRQGQFPFKKQKTSLERRKSYKKSSLERRKFAHYLFGYLVCYIKPDIC